MRSATPICRPCSPHTLSEIALLPTRPVSAPPVPPNFVKGVGYARTGIQTFAYKNKIKTPPKTKKKKRKNKFSYTPNIVRDFTFEIISEEEFCDSFFSLDYSMKRDTLLELLTQFKRAKGYVDISQELCMESLYKITVSAVCRQLKCDNAVLHLYDDVTNLIYHPLSPDIRAKPFGVAKETVVSRRKLHIRYTDAVSERCAEDDLLFGKTAREILSSPIIGNNDKVIGTLSALSNAAGKVPKFTHSDQITLDAIVQQTAAGLGFTLSAREKERMQKQIDSLANWVTEPLDRTTMYKKHAKLLSVAKNCTIFRYDAAHDVLRTEDNIIVPTRAGIVGSSFRTGKVVNISLASSDERFDSIIDNHTENATNTIMCVPIPRKLGVIELTEKQGDAYFTIYDEQIISKLATRFAAEIENEVQRAAVDSSLKAFRKLSFEGLNALVIRFNNNMSASEIEGNRELLLLDENLMRVKPLSLWFGPNTERPLRKSKVSLWSRNGHFVEDVQAALRGTTVEHSASYRLSFPSTKGEHIIHVGWIVTDNVLLLHPIDDKFCRGTLLSRRAASSVVSKSRRCPSLWEIRNSFVSILVIAVKDSHAVSLSDKLIFMKKSTELSLQYEGFIERVTDSCCVIIFGVPYRKDDDTQAAIDCGLKLLKDIELDNIIASPMVVVHTGTITLTENCDGQLSASGETLDSAIKYCQVAVPLYRCPIIISSEALSCVSKLYFIRELDRITLSDECLVTCLYQVFSKCDESFNHQQKKIGVLYDEALTSYRTRSWGDAFTRFENIVNTLGDQTSVEMRARCLRMINSAPPLRWESVWNIVHDSPKIQITPSDTLNDDK